MAFGSSRRNNVEKPILIALCGWPGSGKTEVQKFLTKDFGVVPIDDGGPLRHIAMDHFGLSHDDCYTQEGKTRFTDINGASWENRKILGEIGKALESKFGEFIMPWMATRALAPGMAYSFGSCRRTNGFFYKGQGGIVLEVTGRGEDTGNDFDRWAPEAVTHRIDNSGSLEELRYRVHHLFGPLLHKFTERLDVV